MTDDERIELGHYCEDLLQQEAFQFVLQQFEQQCFQHFVTSKPPNKMERESIYAQYQGANALLDHIRAFVSDKNETLQRIAALSEQDAHIIGID